MNEFEVRFETALTKLGLADRIVHGKMLTKYTFCGVDYNVKDLDCFLAVPNLNGELIAWRDGEQIFLQPEPATSL